MMFIKISSLIKAIPKIIVPKATNCMSSESNVQACLSITESRWQKAKANWSAFYSGFSFLIICLACCSCGSTKVVPIETIRDHQVHDTIVLHNIQYDSVYIYKEMDKDYRRDLHKPLTINPQPLVDTILIHQHDIEYRYKLLRDTIERIKLEVRHDSIPFEVRITETIEVPRKLTWFDHTTRATFWLLIWFLFLWQYRKLHKP